MRFRARPVALGTAVAAVLAVPLAISVTADAAADVLLSRARPVVASSVHSGGYTGANITDGNAKTRWASIGGPGSQWVRIDLGGTQSITRVRLAWETAYAASYSVQTSVDGASWTDVHTTDRGNGGTDDLRRLDGTGRYLRVLAARRGTSYGYSLWEVQVYGPGRPTPAPATPSRGATTKPSRASPSSPGRPVAGAPPAAGLADRSKKDIALQLVSTAENSSPDWRRQYGYIEDIGDGRGYTAGIVGFCSGTSDMLALVQEYTRRKPANALARYLPALRAVDGSDSHAGLDPTFVKDWKTAAAAPVFQRAQSDERDRQYFAPALALARTDRVRTLGQFAYYDAAVMHGVSGLRAIRSTALRSARTPAQGGDEAAWLEAFLDARVAEMRTEEAHSDTSRVDTAQRVFLRAGNLDLDPPLSWSVYGDRFTIGR
jgi:chitosanase